MEISYSTKQKCQHDKVNKELFDWILENNKNAAFAKNIHFDWLSLGFPISVKVEKLISCSVTFSGDKRTEKFTHFGKAKNIYNCACPRYNFHVLVPVAKRLRRNLPLKSFAGFYFTLCLLKRFSSNFQDYQPQQLF